MFADTFGKREATKAVKEMMPLYVEDFANTLGSLDLLCQKGRSRNSAPLRGGLYTVRSRVLWNDAPLRGGLCNCFGKLIPCHATDNISCPLRGGLHRHEVTQHEQTHRERHRTRTVGEIHAKGEIHLG